MDQADSRQHWEHSAPVSSNGKQSNNPETTNPSFEDLRGVYCGEPIAANGLGQTADLAYFMPFVSNYDQPSAASLSLASYTEFEQWPSVDLLSNSVNHADLSLLLSPAYTGLSASQPTHSRVHSSTELSVPYVQSDYGNIFPVYSPDLFDQAIRPLNPTYIECQYLVNDQNFEQDTTLWQSNTALQSSLGYGDSNYVPLDFEQTGGRHITPVTSNVSRCVKCQKKRRRCIIDASDREFRCTLCVKQGTPAWICRLEPPNTTWLTPFEKCGLEKKYPLRYTTIQSSCFGSPRKVSLGHYPNGPTLEVECCQFSATDIIQTAIIRNNQDGCHLMHTTAWCLKSPIINITDYLQECVKFSMDEACAPPRRLSPFFQVARNHYDNNLIKLCFELNTIVRLRRIRWQFSGKESLGMVIDMNKDSHFYGLKPVPRFLQDQLNHALEWKYVGLETDILVGVRSITRNWTRKDCIIGYIALFMLLHAREVYLGSTLPWDPSDSKMNRLWIHQSSPSDLIERVIDSCNSILSYFHSAVTNRILLGNWDSQKSKESDSMKKLSTWVFKLKSDGLVGQRACDIYKVGDPNSVDLTVSSLLFAEKSCEVEGFYYQRAGTTLHKV